MASSQSSGTMTSAIDERLSKLEIRVNGLSEWKEDISKRVDNVETSTSMLFENQEMIKMEVGNQIKELRDQYNAMSRVDRCRLFQLSFFAIIITIVIYYVLNLWHLTIVRE